jgi:hypothetical protein
MFIFKKKLDSIDYTLNTNNIDHEQCRKIYVDIFNMSTETSSGDIYNNLEIYKDYNGDTESTVFTQINKTTTISGEIFLKHRLDNATTDIAVLVEQRREVEALSQHEHFIEEKLKEIAPLERNIIPYCHNFIEQEQVIGSTMVNFRPLNFLNGSEVFLNLYNNYNIFSPIYNLMSPLIVVLIPFLIAKLYFIKDINFGKYQGIFNFIFIGVPTFSMPNNKSVMSMAKFMFTIAMYIYTLYTASSFSLSTQKILRTIHNRLADLKKYLVIIRELQNKFKSIVDIFGGDIYYKVLDDPIYDKPYSLISNKGKLLRHYSIINSDNDNIKKSLTILGKIDCLYSIATLVRNHGYNFTEFIANRQTPAVFSKNFFHPNISAAIPNTIDIGFKGRRNIILTGPNAGGKSTLIKTLSISVLMAQTLGIAPCEKMYLTPFTYMNTYLNIHDIKGEKSLFENEMERVSTHIDTLNELKPTEFAFIIIDELFSGTNPKEGMATSFAVAEKLATFPNSISVITTHYHQLTELKDYANYKMALDTYKLKAGVSTDNIAVDLLKKRNFDQSIIDKAREITAEA